MDSPLDRMIMNANLRCTICGSSRTCACWSKCRCGWSYRTGEACRNPNHGLAEDVATEVIAYIDLMYPDMWNGVAKTARKSLRNVVRREVERALRNKANNHG